jgi:hypothetical protein
MTSESHVICLLRGCLGSVCPTNEFPSEPSHRLRAASTPPSPPTSSYHNNFLFQHYSVAGRLLYYSCALLYLSRCFCRASSMVSLSLAFAIIGLTRTASVRTRSTHTLVPRQLDLRKTSLPLPLVSLKAQISLLLVLGALNSGRARCKSGKTPLAPRNRTWTRDRHQSRLASPRSRQQSSSQTRICSRFYSLRHLAVCLSSYWSRSNPHPHYYRAGVRRRKQRKSFLYSREFQPSLQE